MMRNAFKLKSTKILFAVGVLVTIIFSGFVVFKDRSNIDNSYFRQTTSMIRGNFFIAASNETESLIKNFKFTANITFFVTIVFVLLANLYFCVKFVEGIVERRPYKILPWIIINHVNLVQLAIYFFETDTTMGFLTLVIFCYILASMIIVFLEIKKTAKHESIEGNQSEAEPTDIPYAAYTADKQV